MKAKYIQLLKSCVALAITITVLYMGQALWQSYAVDLPLDKALNSIKGVEKVTWSNDNNINSIISIYVTLSSTTNIQETYEEINNIIRQTLKNRQYTLELKDNRTPELEQLYYNIHHYIQKAIVDGDFPMLNKKVQEIAESAGASAKIYVDEKNVYIQLTKNSNSLYSVVTRHLENI